MLCPSRSPGTPSTAKNCSRRAAAWPATPSAKAIRLQGGTFAANLTRVGEKANYDYLVRWIHNARERTRPYCPYEKKDIGPEDYAKKGLPYQFDLQHSQCPERRPRTAGAEHDGDAQPAPEPGGRRGHRHLPDDAEEAGAFVVCPRLRSWKIPS